MQATPGQLAGFLNSLRADHSGFETGDQQFLAADLMMQTVAGRAEWPAESAAWRTLLAPVLCSSPVEQQRFYELFDLWFANPEQGASNEEAEAAIARGGWRLSRAAWIYAALCLALLAGLTGGVVRLAHQRAAAKLAPPVLLPLPPADFAQSGVALEQGASVVVQDRTGSTLPQANVVFAGQTIQTDVYGHAGLVPQSGLAPQYVLVAKPGYKPVVADFPTGRITIILPPAGPLLHPTTATNLYRQHAFAIRMGILLVPGALLVGWLLYLLLAELELNKWARSTEPRMKRIGVTARSRALYDAADLRRLAVEFKRRRPEESSELNLDATINATCKNAGYFTPAYARRNLEPEYLFLGERKNLRDHQARLQDELLWRLRDHEVYFQRYYFHTAPTTCVDAAGNVFSLGELSALHPEHELWLALDAARCLDPVSGLPERWWNHLAQWRYRGCYGTHFQRMLVRKWGGSSSLISEFVVCRAAISSQTRLSA